MKKGKKQTKETQLNGLIPSGGSNANRKKALGGVRFSGELYIFTQHSLIFSNYFSRKAGSGIYSRWNASQSKPSQSKTQTRNGDKPSFEKAKK